MGHFRISSYLQQHHFFLSLIGCFVEVWLDSYISVINIDDRNESSTGYLLCTVYLKLLRVSRGKQAVVCPILLLSVADTDRVPGVQGRGGGGWRRGRQSAWPDGGGVVIGGEGRAGVAWLSG